MSAHDKRIEWVMGVAWAAVTGLGIFFAIQFVNGIDRIRSEVEVARNEINLIKTDVAVIKSMVGKKRFKESACCDAPRFEFREAQLQLNIGGENEEANRTSFGSVASRNLCCNR